MRNMGMVLGVVGQPITAIDLPACGGPALALAARDYPRRLGRRSCYPPRLWDLYPSDDLAAVTRLSGVCACGASAVQRNTAQILKFFWGRRHGEEGGYLFGRPSTCTGVPASAVGAQPVGPSPCRSRAQGRRYRTHRSAARGPSMCTACTHWPSGPEDPPPDDKGVLRDRERDLYATPMPPCRRLLVPLGLFT